MPKKLSLGLALALTMTVACGVARADTPGKDWITEQQVVQKLKAMGYTEVLKLEADDGHWEGDAVKDGKTYEIHVDPHSGALTKNEPKH